MPTYKGADGRWRYRFAYNGSRESGSTPKGHNTERAAAKMERDHLDKLIAKIAVGKMPTVEEFAKQFLEHQEARTKPLTRTQQTGVMKNHVLPAWKSLRIDQIGPLQVDELVTRWSSDAGGKTINTRLGFVRRMLSLAVEWGYIARVPRFAFRKVAKGTPRFLSDQEATALLNGAAEQWRSMVLVGLRSGLRVGELRGLQWPDVDFRRRMIQVRRTDPGRRKMDATSPKGNRERSVPLTNDAHAVLTELYDSAAQRQKLGRSSVFVWPALLKRQREVRDRARSEKGCHHGINAAADAAGLKGVGWHTLRHTYASHLVMRGVPIRLIQKWLGHASIKETEKYSHLAPDFGHDAVNLLDAPLAPERGNQGASKALPEPSPERNDSVELPDDDR